MARDWRPDVAARAPLDPAVDPGYWFTFSVYQTTFALFGQRRFGWDAPHIGYLAIFATFGVLVQVSSWAASRARSAIAARS